jgi:hypothetical protein
MEDNLVGDAVLLDGVEEVARQKLSFAAAVHCGHGCLKKLAKGAQASATHFPQ